MAASGSSTPPSLASSYGQMLIETPNSHDVLLGRGSGPSDAVGNRRFRSLVKARKKEYAKAPNRKAKHEIAQEVYEHIRGRGGRFLKLLKTSRKRADGTKKSLWIDVTADQALVLEKCKQALREKYDYPDENGQDCDEDQSLERLSDEESTKKPAPLASSSRSTETPVSFAASATQVHPQTLAGGVPPFGSTLGPPSMTPVIPPSMVGMTDPNTDTLLLQALAAGLLPQDIVRHQITLHALLAKQLEGQNHVHTTTANMLARSIAQAPGATFSQNDLLNTKVQPRLCDAHSQPRGSTGPVHGEANRFAKHASSQVDQHQKVQGHTPLPEQDTSGLALLSSIADRPRFTEEEEKMEQAMLTDEERAAVLSDLFGKQCKVSQSKRAKTDWDPEAIAFLINQMRVEIQRIPNERKRALLEAQTKCWPHEFSDERLERFLRCEGMNAKLGAERFVHYWAARRELFGPEKYVLRMTLDEALHDDLKALEDGLCYLLPYPDASGRHLIFWVPCRYTSIGYDYTKESMLRAVWYVMEVASQESSDLVSVIWDKQSKKWHNGLYDSLAYFARACWPVQFVATHICCSPSRILRVFKPLLFALIGKWMRTRLICHEDVPDHEIFNVLSMYGINRAMLPTDMGGTVQFNQADWIANRRASELEAI